MQELKKILEEIEAEHLMCRCKNNEACPYPESIGCCYDEAIRKVLGIIRKHMNDGWIPVEECLPETNADGMSEDVLVSFEESNYIIIAFYNSAERRWNIHGPGPYIGRVIAWRPLPDSYRPERSEE